MGRSIGRGFLLTLAVLAATGAWLWWELRPLHTEVPAAGFVLEDVTVVNPGKGRQPHRTISVKSETIDSIADAAPQAAANPQARRFAGRFVLPGLIDMHVHHPPATPLGDVQLFGLLFLSRGVTSVRDTGNFDGTIFDTRRRIREGAFPGPRVFACGPILDGDPPFWPGSRVVRNEAEARAAVKELARQHADCVKVYERLDAPTLAAIREEATADGLKVIGHVPVKVGFAQAHLADVQHLTGVVDDGQPLTRGRIEGVVVASVVEGIAHTPTIVFWDRMAQLVDYDAPLADPAVRSLPRYYRELLWDPRLDPRLASLKGLKSHEGLLETVRNAKLLVRRLHEAGVTIHAGTDTMNPFIVPGASLHDELRNLCDSGFTVEEAWAAATRVSGESLGVPGLGTLAPGAPADLLVFREDPTRDLAALASLEAVATRGRLYSKETLDRALRRWRAHVENPVFDGLTMQLASWLTAGRTQTDVKRR